MRGRFASHAILAILLVCQFSVCLTTESSSLNDSSKYLDAVRTFADNVLKYGRDTYGLKHTPLFVDGMNIHTHEPVRWIAPTRSYRISIKDVAYKVMKEAYLKASSGGQYLASARQIMYVARPQILAKADCTNLNDVSLTQHLLSRQKNRGNER
jgi:hypothetical protein